MSRPGMGLLKEPCDVPVNNVTVARPFIHASHSHSTERANTKIIPNLPRIFSSSFNRQIGIEPARLQSRVSSPELNWHIVWIPSDITRHRDSDQHSSRTLLLNVRNRRHYAPAGFPLMTKRPSNRKKADGSSTAAMSESLQQYHAQGSHCPDA